METLLHSPTFVINLPRCRDRVPYVREQLKEAGYTQVSIFNAVDGLNTSAVQESLQLFHYPKLARIQPGAIGCLLSHMRLLNYIIESEIPKANVFEDDIHFHPEWETLSRQYYERTPDYEVLFLGNQLENYETLPEITPEYCYCTHAYTVTLEGAKKMLNTILQHKELCEIDCLLRHVLQKNKAEGMDPPFVLYSWNGTKYPCSYNTSSPNHCRNTGLVFQNMNFISQIDDSKIMRLKVRNFKKMNIL